MSPSKRDVTMKAMITNFDEWPPKEKPMPVKTPVGGYHWRKFRPNADWCLMDSNNDVISKAEFHVAYFEAIRMEDHFSKKEVAIIDDQLERYQDKEGYRITLTRNQLRAMAYAVSVHDKQKDKLALASATAKSLTNILNK